MSIQFHYLLKYIIIGNSSVGKSNLLLKFAHNKFLDEYQATIGVEFGAKNIEIDNKIFRIQIIYSIICVPIWINALTYPYLLAFVYFLNNPFPHH